MYNATDKTQCNLHIISVWVINVYGLGVLNMYVRQWTFGCTHLDIKWPFPERKCSIAIAHLEKRDKNN